MDGEAEGSTPLGGIEAEIKELLGLFDVPAFARRGQDLEYALLRLRTRAVRTRSDMLDMVRLRLKQWASAASCPGDALKVFREPIDALWPQAEAPPPRWSIRADSNRRLRRIGRDLVASVERFNRRWAKYLDDIDLTAIHRQVDHYNRYYLLEKEMILGSTRLAARHFEPKAYPTVDELRAALPVLTVPQSIR